MVKLILVFHWSRPCIRPYESRVGCESRGIVEKRHKKAELVKNSPTGHHTYRQDVVIILTRHRVSGVYWMASRRTTMTSPKPLTENPDHKQTSRKDKQTSRGYLPDPCRQDLLFLWVGIYSRDPESGSISDYINPHHQ